MRAIEMKWARIGVVGAFALALATQALPAKAGEKARVVLPSTVRAARTPSKPTHVPPPIGISASKGALFFRKPHHKQAVMLFEITLSRQPGKTPVTVDFATMGSTPFATSEFQEISGQATFRGTQKKFRVYVPIYALTTDRSNVLSLVLSEPTNGVISRGQGTAVLVAKGHVR